MQTSPQMHQLSWPASQSQLPLCCNLPMFTLLLLLSPLVSGALLHVLTFCLPFLHLLLCLVLLCLRPIPVHSSSLLCECRLFLCVLSSLLIFCLIGELDLPLSTHSCSFSATPSICCSYLSTQHHRVAVQISESPVVHCLSSIAFPYFLSSFCHASESASICHRSLGSSPLPRTWSLPSRISRSWTSTCFGKSSLAGSPHLFPCLLFLPFISADSASSQNAAGWASGG